MNQTRPAEYGKLIALCGLMAWAYLPTLAYLWSKWMDEPQYSHGVLVPLFSLYLLTIRAKTMPVFGTPVPLAGAAFFLVAFACRMVSAQGAIPQLDAFSILPSLAGVALIVGGWTTFRWAWPAIGFLAFSIPLLYKFEIMMGGPLQQLATWCSTFVLQTLGQPAVAEGNTILINDVKLGVAEACSGLRMMMTFTAFSVGAAFLMERTWIEKTIIVLSAVPIALLTNMLRIVVTGLAYVYLPESHGITDFLHDAYGWLMMPVGLGFLMLELWLLSKLLIAPEGHSPVVR